MLHLPLQHNTFYQKTVTERERIFNDRIKAKSKYDEGCLEAESTRHKVEKSDTDRARRGHDAAEAESWNAKVRGRQCVFV